MMWLAFSIPRNFHVLFAEKTDELSKEMSTVNGIRSIGSVEVIMGHIFFRIISLPFSNTYEVQQVLSNRYACACNIHYIQTQILFQLQLYHVKWSVSVELIRRFLVLSGYIFGRQFMQLQKYVKIEPTFKNFSFALLGRFIR